MRLSFFIPVLFFGYFASCSAIASSSRYFMDEFIDGCRYALIIDSGVRNVSEKIVDGAYLCAMAVSPALTIAVESGGFSIQGVRFCVPSDASPADVYRGIVRMRDDNADLFHEMESPRDLVVAAISGLNSCDN